MELLSSDKDAARTSLALRTLLVDFQDCISSIERCNRPVIGVAHRHSIGLACDILSAVDVRYAASDAVFSIREVAIGLAADMGSLQRFPKIVGNDSLTRELAFTGRDFNADEALRMGFVSRVCGSKDEAMGAFVCAMLLTHRRSGQDRVCNCRALADRCFRYEDGAGLFARPFGR